MLQIGAPETVVLVSGSSGAIDTNTAAIHGSIPEVAIREMPVLTGPQSRSVLAQLQLLLPGASSVQFNGLGDSYGMSLSINGSTLGGVGFSFDGVDNSYLLGTVGGSITIGPNPDALQEVSVNSQNYKAESGGHQAEVTLRTRSGTNRFHAQARALQLNPKLSARDFFSTAANPSFYRTDAAGFNLGGPVELPHLYDGHNRTFGFFDAEWTRTAHSQAFNATFPSDAERHGDFGALPQDQWPIDPATGRPFPDGRIPADRILPQSRFFIDQFIPPDPSGGIVSLTSEDRASGYQFTTRVDHRLGAPGMVNGSLFFYRDTDIYTDSRTLGTSTLNAEQGYNLSIQYIRSFSARATNALMFGNTWWKYDWMPTGKFMNVDLMNEGYNIHNITGGPHGYPNVYMDSNRYEPSGYARSESPRTFHWKDDFSLQRGAHAWKLGADLRYAIENYFDFTWGAPGFTFSSYNTKGTGDDLADLLLGIPYGYSQASDPKIRARRLLAALYAQDDVRLHAGLTLNLGLRYEMNGNYVSQDGQVSIFRPGSRSAVFPNAPAGVLFTGDFDPLHGGVLGSTVIPPDRKNFAPRIGIAWSPGFQSGLAGRLFGGPGRTSIRAGYGIYHILGLGSAGFKQARVQPWFHDVSLDRSKLDASGGNMLNPWGTGIDPFAGAVSQRDFFLPLQDEYYVDSRLRSPYQYQWSLSLERQIAKDIVVEIAYVGNRSLHLLRQYQGNPALVTAGATQDNVESRRAYKDFGKVAGYVSDGTSVYNALQLGVSRRFSSRLLIEGHYVWSRTLDNVGGTGNVFNLADPASTPWARANSDRTHNFVGYWVFSVPAQFRSPLLKWALSGWRLSGNVQLRSGVPLQIRNPIDSTWQGLAAAMPDIIGTFQSFDPRQVRTFKLPNGRTFTGNFFFDPTVFRPVIPKTPVETRIGNLGRNVFSGPGTADVDLSLAKEFRVKERHRFEIRAEAVNAFNHAQFVQGNGGANNNQFGRVTSTSGPRRIQIQLRYSF